MTATPTTDDTDAATGWRSMATAPKDGTRVLLLRKYCGKDYIVCGEYNDGPYPNKPRPYWRYDSIHMFGMVDARTNPPAGWMPLPTASAPPQVDAIAILTKLQQEYSVRSDGPASFFGGALDACNRAIAALRAGNTTEAGR